MKDLVYTLKAGSVNQDLELRYSLRSLDKHACNYNKVVIVGHCPDWVDQKQVLYIPFEQIWYKERNIMSKLLQVSQDSRVSEDFIHFNDDYFLTNPWDFALPTNFCATMSLRESLDNGRSFGAYPSIIRRTWEFLHKHALPILHYDVHLPFTFNKDLFVSTMTDTRLIWEDPTKRGYVIRSLYGNMNQIEAQSMKDVKFIDFINWEVGLQVVNKLKIFSSGETLTHNVIKVLENLYPKKSRYEK